MSLEQAKLFIERMKTDEAFRAKIMAVEDVAGRLRLANAEGFDCTEEEIKTVFRGVTDPDLEGVVGGTDSNCGAWGASRGHYRGVPACGCQVC